MKTRALEQESITVELTEFEMTALVALVERGQNLVSLNGGDQHDIRHAIHNVADEFRSLLGHFELVS